MEVEDPEQPGSRRLISRRDVLGWASACGLGSLLAAPAAARQLLGLNAPVELPMSVGFLRGSEGLKDVRSLPWQRSGNLQRELTVEPAAALPLGDQSLALSTVLLTVHGLYPRVPPARLGGFRNCNLLVMFPSEDPLAPGLLPAVPWGLRRLPQQNLPARVRFPVPLREDGGLDLALELTDQNGTLKSAVRLVTSFTVDWYDGRPKLQRGIYFLGLATDTWASSQVLPPREDRRHDELCSLVVSFEPAPEE